MSKKIIIHSHFYQPPRQNPNTLEIDKEESAFPYHDWNERITSECYRANAYARYLDKDARIRKIINNYRYMSFNVGPTLLEYIEKKYPDVASRILEADMDSIKRLGHGNAIAQGYNHTILPLDDKEFARNQIKHGLDKFRSFFKRDAEGFWCPECAISPFVIDLLAEEGVKFTILSPLQIKSLIIEGVTIQAKDIKYSMLAKPFYIRGNNHKICAMFYNAALSSDISFNHLLQSADRLYDNIKQIFVESDSPLVMAATDGEIYGHHEPYGEMAFAALSEKVASRGEFEFTNPAKYISENTPSDEAVLIDGEDNLGSSWSCFHGVSRWYKDCSCSTGGKEGWNQKWRTPLRNALVKAKSSVMSQISSILTQHSLDVNETIRLPFESQQSMRIAAFDQSVKKALEAYKWMSYSFTSCGWFFADISGLEASHNIGFMIKALKLLNLNKDLEVFINDLTQAESNIKEMQNGGEIAKNIIKTYFENIDIKATITNIKRSGLTNEIADELLTILMIQVTSPTSDYYFDAQNTVYQELQKGSGKEIKNIKLLAERLNLSTMLI